MQLPHRDRLNPNHVLMFETALKHLEAHFPNLHPLEFAHAMELRSQALRIEAAEQFEANETNFYAKNQIV